MNALIVIGILGCGLLAALLMLFKLRIPDSQLIRSMVETSDTLGKSLQSHKQSLQSHEAVVKSLPSILGTKVSEEVQRGIQPLNQEISVLRSQLEQKLDILNAYMNKNLTSLTAALNQSHNHFINALLTINDDGKLTDWVNSFQKAIQPLEQMTEAIGTHYHTSQGILTKFTEFVGKWAGHWGNVEGSFAHFSKAVAEWSATESEHLRDMESRVMNRLEEVARIEHLVADGLSESQSAQTRLMESNQLFTQKITETVNITEAILDLAKDAQDKIRHQFQIQQNFQADYKTWQTGMQTRAEGVQVQVENIAKQFAETAQQLHQQMQVYLVQVKTSLEQMLAQMAGQYHTLFTRWEGTLAQAQGVISGLVKQYNEVVRLQNDLTQRQNNVLDRIESLLDRTPSKEIQRLQTAFLGLQAVLLLVGVLMYAFR